ncbi:hypothetical protein SAMN05421783_104248 [Thiocapsa roseopersicina]|uniref:Uncharacterized protein n=1 Tax=Thiocapsa roseopersicina TaxID=1058 RepID=A0A1H2U019_THIRO|nr:hypothetical protein SAMN05421783_104248 [Thiocapsa roseopersicina]
MGLEDRDWYWKARDERDRELARKAERVPIRSRFPGPRSGPVFGSDLGPGPEIDLSRYKGLFRLLLAVVLFFAAIVLISFVFVTVLRML